MQEYPVNVGAPQISIFGVTLFVVHIKDPLDVICNISMYADAISMHLYSKSDQAADLWQQLGLDPKLESDQQHTTD